MVLNAKIEMDSLKPDLDDDDGTAMMHDTESLSRSFGRGASLLASSLAVYPYNQRMGSATLVVRVAQGRGGMPAEKLADRLSGSTGRGWFAAVGGAFSFELLSDSMLAVAPTEISFSDSAVSVNVLSYSLPCFMSATQIIFDAFDKTRESHWS